MNKRALQFDLEPEEGDWWSHWHYHADRRGWGSLGWSYRYPHIRALCIVFRTIARRGPRFSTPFQAWITINGEDASQDATFLHTPNPHSDFPMRPPLIEVEETALDRIFSALLPELHLHFGWSRHRYEDEGIEHWSTLHWVWAEGIGVPLWPPTTGGMHSLRLPSAKETLR